MNPAMAICVENSFMFLNPILAAARPEFAYVIPIVVFLGVIALFWFMLDFFTKDQAAQAEQRLDILNDKLRGQSSVNKEGKVELLNRALEKASPALSKHIQPQTEAERGRLRQRLSEAGFRSEEAANIFLAIKVLIAVAGLFVGGGLTLFTHGVSNQVLLRAVIAGGLGFYLPELILSSLGSKRKKQITLALPDCLDLLVVSVEAGLGLDQGIRKVADEMKGTYPILTEELQLSTLQLQMGRARSSVLQDLGARTGVDDLRTLASLLIQADKFGSGVAQALRVQSESMRTKRQQIAEEKAAKTAVKLIFPLVIFIFPGVFVVLVGPAAIQMAREMFPAMSGGR